MKIKQKKIAFLEDYKELLKKHNMYFHTFEVEDDIVEIDGKKDLEFETQYVENVIRELKQKL